MAIRKDVLVEGGMYHVCTKSIAGFNIFNNDNDFERMRQSAKYYKFVNDVKFSDFISSKAIQVEGFNNLIEMKFKEKDQIVKIIAYCFMPTHIHLILNQLSKNGISEYMCKVLNSYSLYFNNLHKRRGPLWESRFKNVLVKDDEQLLHLTRYFHINPVTAHLCDSPDDWQFSSYKEYLSKEKEINFLCQFNDLMDIQPSQYRKFVNDRISYQRELGKIKKLILE